MPILALVFKTKGGAEIVTVDYSKGDHIPNVGETVSVQVVADNDARLNYEVTEVITNIEKPGRVTSFEVTLKKRGQKGGKRK